jgi:hypothetical protein
MPVSYAFSTLSLIVECGSAARIFLVWPNVHVLVAGILRLQLRSSTDSVVHGYSIAMTPDRLLGRSESVRSTISLVIAPLGPLAAGLLLGTGSERATSPS